MSPPAQGTARLRGPLDQQGGALQGAQTCMGKERGVNGEEEWRCRLDDDVMMMMM